MKKKVLEKQEDADGAGAMPQLKKTAKKKALKTRPRKAAVPAPEGKDEQDADRPEGAVEAPVKRNPLKKRKIAAEATTSVETTKKKAKEARGTLPGISPELEQEILAKARAAAEAAVAMQEAEDEAQAAKNVKKREGKRGKAKAAKEKDDAALIPARKQKKEEEEAEILSLSEGEDEDVADDSDTGKGGNASASTKLASGGGRGGGSVGGDDKNSRKIFVGGLPFSVSEEVVRSDFAVCGEIDDFLYMRDSEGKPKGIAFVTYKKIEGVKKALEYDGEDYGGRTLKVSMATTRSNGKGDGEPGKGKGRGKGRGTGDDKGKEKGKAKGKGKGKDKGKGKGKGKKGKGKKGKGKMGNADGDSDDEE